MGVPQAVPEGVVALVCKLGVGLTVEGAELGGNFGEFSGEVLGDVPVIARPTHRSPVPEGQAPGTRGGRHTHPLRWPQHANRTAALRTSLPVLVLRGDPDEYFARLGCRGF